MIDESFCFLPGVRLQKERAIWKQGVTFWSDFLDKRVKGISKHKEQYDYLIRRAQEELKHDNEKFFAHHLPDSEHWRLYDQFKDEAVYLDIETNGYRNGITIIGLSDGVDTKTMVRGHNFDKRMLTKELSKYKLIVTFNGQSFDIPVLERFFGIHVRVPHIDLRFVCQRAGLAGGLKSIEKQLNIKRRDSVDGLSGGDAVTLWSLYKETGNKEYLDQLIEYNEEDALNLRPLARKVIPTLWQLTRHGKLPFESR